MYEFTKSEPPRYTLFTPHVRVINGPYGNQNGKQSKETPNFKNEMQIKSLALYPLIIGVGGVFEDSFDDCFPSY